MPDEQLAIDFGTDELNDPNYEQKVDEQTPAGGDDDGAAPQPTPDNQAQQSGDEGAAPQPAAGQPAGDGTGTGGAAQQGGQPQQGQPQRGARTDKEGNLVDAQGNIVAKAGAERRQYERTQAQANHITRLEQENADLRKQASMSGALNDVPAKLGLDMRETEMGLQAIASFKKDPVATARWMLQETMRLGYDLPTIIGKDAQGQVAGGSLDLQAIKSMIADQVAPLVQDRTAAQQAEQSRQEAQRDYDAFMSKHDHASVHEDVLATMLQQNKSLTPEVAYWQLREYATKHGFDFTKPLREQAVARQQGAQQQPQGNATPQAQSPQPMPNGGAPVNDLQTQGTYADADDAWDSIVNQSLREAGFVN